MKLIALSDLHLTPPGELVVGLDPHPRLQAAIAKINAEYRDADLVMILGDLTDRGRTAAFEALRDALQGLQVPYALTLGNHDNRDVFTRVFDGAHLDPRGFAQAAFQFGKHRLILLDTLERSGSTGAGWGAPFGKLCDTRLAWLRAQLDDAPTVIAMHHPAVRFDHAMDPYSLAEPERLLADLSGHDVRLIVSGHIHMSTTAHWRGHLHATLSGNLTSSHGAFGETQDRTRVSGPSQMAIITATEALTCVHYEEYGPEITLI